MILNSESVELIRRNASRLAAAVNGKEDLVDLATASSFEQVFSAIETILTNTDMFFDDELLAQLDANAWQSFKATLLVFTLNTVNRQLNNNRSGSQPLHFSRDFGASSTTGS